MIKKLIQLSIAVSILWHPLALIFDFISEDHDKSTQLLHLPQFYNHILKWDALFFYEIAIHGYKYLKNHAFGIGLPYILRLFQQVSQQYSILIVLLIQKVINLLSTILIYKISQEFTENKQIPYLSAILFIFTPASAYFNSLYTESIFTFLIVLGIYLQNKDKIIISAITLSISQFFRSNGLFYIIYSGLPILCDFLIQLKQKKINILSLSQGILVGIIYLIPYAINVYIPYQYYCHSEHSPEWCHALLPQAYGYIQKHFWNVGFLSSYKPEKALFIFFGIQGILLMGYWMFILFIRRKSDIKLNIQSIGLFLQQIILFIVATFYAHVNCSTRFFSTSLMFYWALAELWHRQKWFVLFYIIEFNLGGLLLFTNFYLWA